MQRKLLLASELRTLQQAAAAGGALHAPCRGPVWYACSYLSDLGLMKHCGGQWLLTDQGWDALRQTPEEGNQSCEIDVEVVMLVETH